MKPIDLEDPEFKRMVSFIESLTPAQKLLLVHRVVRVATARLPALLGVFRAHVGIPAKRARKHF